MQIDIPLMFGMSKNPRDADIETRRQVNILPVASPTENSQGYHRFFPGLIKLHDVAGVSRGAEYNVAQDAVYRVMGNGLYKDGDQVGKFTVSGFDRVSMAHSRNSQGVLTGGKLHLYRYDGTENTFDYAQPLSDTCQVVARYASVIEGSDSFIISSLEDESKPDPVAPIYRAESQEDGILAIKEYKNFLVCFGSATVEYFRLTGDAKSVYVKQDSYFIDKGIVGRDAICRFSGTYAFVTSPVNGRRSVAVLGSGDFNYIADKQLEKDLKKYSSDDISKCVLESTFIHEEEKLILHLPDKTYVYSSGSGVWSETSTDGKTHRAIDYVLRGDIVTVGDQLSPIHGQLDNTSRMQYGEDSEVVIYTTIIEQPNRVLNDIEFTSEISETSEREGIMFAYTEDGVFYGGEQRYGLDEPLEWIKRPVFDFGMIDFKVGFRWRFKGGNPLTIHGVKGELL